MIAKLSPLQLTDFQLLNFKFHFINPNTPGPVNPNELFDQYQIDVDFAIKRFDDNTFSIFTKAAVNESADHAGYDLFAEGVSTFHLTEPAALPESTRQNLLVFSGVGIALQQLRSRIADLTSFAPFGKYILPTLDMDDLLKRKREEAESKPVVPTKRKHEGKRSAQNPKADSNDFGPNMDTFRDLIQHKLQEAHRAGLEFLDLTAKDLHKEGGGDNGDKNRTYACCRAMYEAQRDTDQVLQSPPSGYGRSLKIRYQLPR